MSLCLSVLVVLLAATYVQSVTNVKNPSDSCPLKNNKSIAEFMKENPPDVSDTDTGPEQVETKTDEVKANSSSLFKYNEFIELDATNHVSLRGPVTEDSVTRLLVNMAKVKHDDIILYMSSPGGSVIAGQLLIQQINYLQRRGHKVHCVADIAASMAFAILQACDDRYVTPSSILMQHQMSLGVSGQLFNIKSRLKLMNTIESDMTRRQAKRMGMEDDDFTEKITSDWWLFGNESVSSNAADVMLQVGCSNELMTTKVEETFYVQTFLGRMPIDAVFSACPLTREPLEVKMKRMFDLTKMEQLRLNSEVQTHFENLFNDFKTTF